MLFSKKRYHPLYPVSQQLRLEMLDMTRSAGAGHIGGALSSLDIILSLYQSPLFDFNHDHFILSAGHLCLAHYVVLARQHPELKSKLNTFSRLGSIFQGHESTEVPGVEYSSGSLGQGLSFACGLALGDAPHHTVCLTTDGEHNEGQVWEAVMLASKYKLGNLINIIIRDNIQIDGNSSQIMPLGDLASKYLRFGWTVINLDGHNFYEHEKAFKRAIATSSYPICLVAKTTFGKGISFMENNPQFHHVKNLSDELYLKSKYELSVQLQN